MTGTLFLEEARGRCFVIGRQARTHSYQTKTLFSNVFYRRFGSIAVMSAFALLPSPHLATSLGRLSETDDRPFQRVEQGREFFADSPSDAPDFFGAPPRAAWAALGGRVIACGDDPVGYLWLPRSYSGIPLQARPSCAPPRRIKILNKILALCSSFLVAVAQRSVNGPSSHKCLTRCVSTSLSLR
jgi:hypothetical protein